MVSVRGVKRSACCCLKGAMNFTSFGQYPGDPMTNISHTQLHFNQTVFCPLSVTVSCSDAGQSTHPNNGCKISILCDSKPV